MVSRPEHLGLDRVDGAEAWQAPVAHQLAGEIDAPAAARENGRSHGSLPSTV